MLDQRVFRLGEDFDQRLFVEILEGGDDRQAADEFGDQAEFQQILRLDLAQHGAGAAVIGAFHIGAEADARALAALADDAFEAGKGAADDEEDIGGIHLQEFLLRVLSAALGRHGGDRAFHDLQQGLLHTLARYVAGDGRVVGFAGDFIDLVDIDDAALRPFHIVIGGLQQLEDDVLHILADIAGLGQRGRIGHGEGHVENAGEGLGQQGLARAGGAEQHDVGFGDLDLVVLRLRRQPLVMVVHGYGQDLLGVFLADDVIIQHLADFARRGHPIAALHQRGLVLFTDDIHAEFDAFITDEHRRPSDQLAHLMLRLAAEGTIQRVLGIAGRLAHARSSPAGPAGRAGTGVMKL